MAPQTAGSQGLNGGGTAAAVPTGAYNPFTVAFWVYLTDEQRQHTTSVPIIQNCLSA